MRRFTWYYQGPLKLLKRSLDTLLHPFLSAGDEEARTHALDALFREHLTPVIRSAVRRAAHDGDAEELEAQANLVLLDRLRSLDPAAEPLSDIKAYAATAAYRVGYSWLRRKKPNRTRLRQRVRYVLEHGRRLGPGPPVGRPVDAEILATKLRPFANGPLPEAMDKLYSLAGGSLELEMTVDILARAQDLREPALGEFDERRFGSVERDLAAEIDRRTALGRLWTEVRELPLNQRHAILLNLRDDDGESVIELLPVLGVASVRELAASLGLTAEAFAELWPQLPLDDRAIALRLGLERQQVINLRKTGRARLMRRFASRSAPLVIIGLIAHLGYLLTLLLDKEVTF